MLGVRERVWSAMLSFSQWVTRRPGPSHRLKQEKLIVRANYNKQQYPGSYFLEVKSKSHRQATPAQRTQNLHAKTPKCPRADFSDKSIIESAQSVRARGDRSWSTFL